MCVHLTYMPPNWGYVNGRPYLSIIQRWPFGWTLLTFCMNMVPLLLAVYLRKHWQFVVWRQRWWWWLVLNADININHDQTLNPFIKVFVAILVQFTQHFLLFHVVVGGWVEIARHIKLLFVLPNVRNAWDHESSWVWQQICTFMDHMSPYQKNVQFASTYIWGILLNAEVH